MLRNLTIGRPSLVRLAKSLIYKGARYSGINAVLLRSQWRNQRLLILCYHGISLDDEHEWMPSMYFPPSLFRQRLEQLRSAGCEILALETALELLRTGNLPPRAVVITFDDGFYDFSVHAWPLLREFQYPVTVYLSSYYSEYNVPAFDLMCPYLLWKGKGQAFRWTEMGVPQVMLDAASARSAAGQIMAACRAAQLDGVQKNAVLRDLAVRLGLDFDDFCRRRILHLLTPAEAAELARQGVDFQLHGHWHRVSRWRERFWNEVSENKAALARMGVHAPAHYCYPTGLRLPEFGGWLAEFGVRSAVTCDMDLASGNCDFYALPRFVDHAGSSGDEFAAWLSGLAKWMPRPPTAPDPGQLDDQEVAAERAKAAANV